MLTSNAPTVSVPVCSLKIAPTFASRSDLPVPMVMVSCWVPDGPALRSGVGRPAGRVQPCRERHARIAGATWQTPLLQAKFDVINVGGAVAPVIVRTVNSNRMPTSCGRADRPVSGCWPDAVRAPGRGQPKYHSPFRWPGSPEGGVPAVRASH